MTKCWDGNEKTREVVVLLVVTVLDRGLSLSICGIALRLVECSATQADIKGYEFLLRTQDGTTTEHWTVEKAVK